MGLLDEFVATSTISDEEAQRRADAKKKERKTGQKRPKGMDLSEFLGPRPTQLEERPTAIVLFWTRTVCRCGQVYKHPTYTGSSTFVRWETFRLHMGYRRVRPYAVKWAPTRYVPYAGGYEDLGLLYHTEWVDEKCVTCPECHGRSTSPKLPFPDPMPIPHAVAIKKHYDNLLHPPPKPQHTGGGGTVLSNEAIRADIGSVLLDSYAIEEALWDLDARKLARRLNELGHIAIAPRSA